MDTHFSAQSGRVKVRVTRQPGFLACVSGLLALFALPVAAQTNPLVVSTVAGLANFGSADGIGSAAKFLLPASIAVDGAGNVYVADAYNSTIRKVSTNGVVTTIAGQAGVSGSSGGPATNGASFLHPYGVAIDSSNNIYVADTGNNLIREITNGFVTTIGGTASPPFYYPYGLATDSAGNVYVADTGNSLIRKIANGSVTTIGGAASPPFYYPYAVATDSATNVYVADTYHSLIRLITPAGVVTTIGGSANPAFSYPTGIAVDSATNVYVADTDNQIIRVITPGGEVYTLAGVAGIYGDGDGLYGSPDATFRYPWGVAVDSAGNVYVGDSGNGNIRKITPPSDALSTLAGPDESYGVEGPVDGPAAQARFNQPFGVVVDGATNLYVADFYNNCIRLVTPAGIVTTLAGSVTGNIGTNDGTNTSAEFRHPIGLCLDAATNIYVADYYNSTVRKITPDAAHSNWVTATIAGQAGAYTFVNNPIGTDATFDGPYAVAVDGATNLYVTDIGNKAVRKLTLSGTNWAVITYASGPFMSPCGIAVDSSTNVYVTDSSNNLVYSVAPSGVVTTFANNFEGLFNSPQGVAVDSAGNIYIANTGTNTILGITSGGQFTNTIAGTAGLAGSADGLGSAAQFDSPVGLAVDASSNVYVADALNNTIRKGTPYTAQTVVLTLTTSPDGLPLEVNGMNYAYTPQVIALATNSTNTVTATANSGYIFADWTTNGVVASSSNSYTFTLNTNETLIANFLPLYNCTVSTLPTNGGTVSGSGAFAPGSTNTVTATANSGYVFADWTTNGVVASSSNSYTFTLITNEALVANFTPTSPQIEVLNGTTVITNGQTIPVSFGSVQQNQTGPVVTFTVTNAGGQTLDLDGITVPSGYTLNTNYPSTIAAGSSGAFSVQLITTSIATNSGNIVISNNAPGDNPFTFAVTGAVTNPSPQIEVLTGTTVITNGQTVPVSFGSVQQNQTGPTIVFTVTNTGGLALDLTAIMVPAGYTLNTNYPSIIAAGSNGTFSVQLITTNIATNSGNIIISNNAPGNNPFTFAVTGAVTPTLSQIQVFAGTNVITNGQTNAVNFGSIQQNQTGPTIVFTVTNAGGQTLDLTNMTVPAGYTVTTNPPATIAAGSNGTFSVQLDSSTVGTKSGNIIISNNAPGNNPFTFAVTGAVTSPPPQIQVFAGTTVITNGQTIPVSFGSVQQNQTGPTIVFTVTNAGGQTLDLTNITVPAGYIVTTNPPATIAAGSNGTFSVQLITTSIATNSGNIVISNNAPGNNPFTFAITGIVTSPPPQIEVLNGTTVITNGQMIPVSFGSVQQNQTGPVVTFTVTNSGGLTLDLTAITVPSGYTLNTNYPSAIAAGSNGTFSVQLITTNIATNSGNIVISNNAPGNNPFTFAITGTVTPTLPQIQVFAGTNVITNGQTNAVNFGSVQQNQTGSNVTFTVTNAGGQTLDLTNITVPSGYTLNTNYPSKIAAGSNGTFSVQLTAKAIGAYSGDINITNNSPNNPFFFPITGLVTGSIISLGGNLMFGVVPIGSSGQGTLTISNGGNTKLTVSSIGYPTGFSGAFSNTIAAGGSTNVTVTFSPTSATNYSGTVTVNSDATGGTNTISITAFGANTNLLLTLITNGEGTVTPNDAKVLKQGAKISLKAVAGKADVFSDWTGSINSTNNPLIFTMKKSTILQVNFIPNPFLPFVGTYNGLFWATNGIVGETNAGMLKGLTLTSKGTYSGSLLINGANKSISGSFNVAGQAGKSISLGGNEGNVEVVMTLTSNDPAPQVTGTVSGTGWVSTNLTADRATNNSQLSTQYTMLIPPDTNEASSPGGCGYALITGSAGTAKTAATAKITGALADGTAFSQSVPVSQDGYVPLYASLYSGKGLLLGWINLDPTNDSGALFWVHPVRTGLFTGAFTSTNQIKLSPWTNLPATSEALPTNLLVLEMSNSTTLQTNNFVMSIGSNFKLGQVSGPTNLSGTINPKTGLLTVTIGSGASKQTGYGVILPNGTNGGGYLLTRTNAGAIILQP